jgi:hypothetical protein
MTQDVNGFWRIRVSFNFYSQDEQNSTNTKKVGMSYFLEMQSHKKFVLLMQAV